MLHIDFSYILGCKPPIDGPPISLSPDMVSAFQRVGAWDTFVSLCASAFLALRRRAPALQRLCAAVFGKAGFTGKEVEAFLTGPSSLATASDYTEEEAAQAVRKQVERSADDVGNWFKEFTHEHVVPGWYRLLKKGFPPAMAVMQFVDERQQRKAEQKAAAASEGVEVDEEETMQV